MHLRIMKLSLFTALTVSVGALLIMLFATIAVAEEQKSSPKLNNTKDSDDFVDIMTRAYNNVLLGEARWADREAIRARIAAVNPGGKEMRFSLGALTGVPQPNYPNRVPDEPFPAGRVSIATLETLDGERNFEIYVPASYSAAAAKGPVALMVLFHGLGDTCDNFLQAAGFMDYAERDGFVIASACGTQGLLGRGWNSGVCCGFTDAKRPDDITFAGLVVEAVKKGGISVDDDKIMAVGFSNGAMLVEVLSCFPTSPFRAAVSVGGVMEIRPGNAEGQEVCDAVMNGTAAKHAVVSKEDDFASAIDGSAASERSLLLVHGTSDFKVPWGGYHFIGFSPQDDNLIAWAARLGCSDANGPTIHTENFENTILSGCRKNPRQLNGSNAESGTATQKHVRAMLANTENAPKPSRRSALLDMQRQQRQSKYGGDTTQALLSLTNSTLERPHTSKGVSPHLHTLSTGSNREAAVHQVTAETKRPSKPVTGAAPQGPFVEMVAAIGAGHTWPEHPEFSTTEYIYEFGRRVFGEYRHV